MADSFSLARSYAAAATSGASARSSGVSYGTTPGILAAGRWERRRLLQRAIASGKVKESDLGQHDRSLLTSGISGGEINSKYKAPGQKDDGKSFFGFIKNLGVNVGNTLRYLPGGLYTFGKAIVDDALINPPKKLFGDMESGYSETYDKVLKPVGQSYADTYGNGPGHFWNSFYNEPLGPILDAAAVFTGGSTLAAKGGAAVTKTAVPGSRLANMAQKGIALTSREGRPSLVHPLDPEIKLRREYTPRPIPKLWQQSLDRVTKTGPEENYLGKFIRGHHQRKNVRVNEVRAKTQLYDEIGHEIEPLKEAILKLSTEEAVALTIAQKGVNTPGKIAAFQRAARETLNNPAELAKMKNQFNISEDYIRYQAQLPIEVKKLVLNPNENMVSAHQVWKERVKLSQEEKGLGPEITQQHLKNEADKLREYSDFDLNEPASSYPIEHTYVPSELASGFDLYQPNPRGLKSLPGRVRGTEPAAYFRRGKTDSPRAIKGERYDQSLFVPEKQRSDYRSSGETFTSGGMRVDPRLYLDHIAEDARVRAETAFSNSELNRIALRKEDGSGDLAEFATQTELDAWLASKGRKPGEAVLVNDAFPIAYFVKEQDLIKDVNAAIHAYADEKGVTAVSLADDADLDAIISRMVDDDAKAFVKTHWGAMKRKGKAIPKEEFEYRVKLAKVHEPFDNSVARALTRARHYWQVATLNYMPRWAINTAAGSAMLNTVRGVNISDYRVANKLRKAGFLPEELATDTLKTALPTGARIGNQAVRETLEAAAPGYGNRSITMTARDMGIGFPTEKLARGVQDIEDYFRQAQFIHNLKREAKLDAATKGRNIDILGDEGKALVETGYTLQAFYDDLLGPEVGGSIGKALQNPKLVERALNETDKLMYNYAILGPTERRIVRQFIPFWGWYKFISMAAYRLPVEYPGRFALMNSLSGIAEETERDLYGELPAWLKGTIALSNPEDKNYRYLATFGLNPFSQVFNPLGEEGPIGGTLQLGQFNPLIGATLSAYGLDPMTGDQVAISPETAGRDFFGKLWMGDKEVAPWQAGGGRRFLMGLARSFPEFQLLERKVLNPSQGYQAAYPESVPFLSPRPMKAPVEGTTGLDSLLIAATGKEPKTYENYRQKELLRRKRSKAAMKASQTQTRKLRRDLSDAR